MRHPRLLSKHPLEFLDGKRLDASVEHSMAVGANQGDLFDPRLIAPLERGDRPAVMSLDQPLPERPVCSPEAERVQTPVCTWARA